MIKMSKRKGSIPQSDNASPLRLGLRRLRKNKLALLGLTILSFIIFMAVFAPFLTTHDRDRVNLRNTYKAPSDQHRLGTDELGRDTFTRLLYGSRVSLMVGLVSTGISLAIGVILGALAGYYGKFVDSVIMRLVDIFMSLPYYALVITVAAIFGPSIWNLMIMTGLLRWTGIARMVRAEVLSLKEREFVEASRAIGLNAAEIIFKHILPNTLAIIMVYATLGIAQGILSEAGLSYLGLGVKQPTPSWGNMLSSAQSLRSLRLHWWLWVPPGMLVFITILSINFVGDGLRDALDPKLKD